MVAGRALVGELSQGTAGIPAAPSSGIGIVNWPQWGRNRKSSAPPETVARSGQKAVKSNPTARENRRPAKRGPSLRRAPGQNRTLLLSSPEQKAKENNSGTPTPRRQPPVPSPSLWPTPLQRDCDFSLLVTHSSPGSGLWGKWPRNTQELSMDGLGEGPGLQEGKTEGLKSPWLATVLISRTPGEQKQEGQ